MLQESKFSFKRNPHICRSYGSEENLKNVKQIFLKKEDILQGTVIK